MPGPFPGMDPYLENPARWPGFHQPFITFIASALNAHLPERYVAETGERLYVVPAQRDIYPDGAVLQRLAKPQTVPPHAAPAAVALISDPPWVLPAVEEEHREGFVQILKVGDESQVIAVIEVLSPANKSANHDGRRLYLLKQEEVLLSRTHLIELDLLRQGEHTVAAPRVRLTQFGTWDYLACLHRGGGREAYLVWPIHLRERLPRIRVPLAEDDADIVLDLQAVLDRTYDEGGFARRLDYRGEPWRLLPPPDAEWASALLRERGLRE